MVSGLRSGGMRMSKSELGEERRLASTVVEQRCVERGGEAWRGCEGENRSDNKRGSVLVFELV